MRIPFSILKIYFALLLQFVLLLSTQTIKAQNATIDSLVLVLRTTSSDTTYLNTLNSISVQFLNISDFNTTLQYSERAQEKGERLISIYENKKELTTIKRAVAFSYNNIGRVKMSQGNNSDALNYFLISLKIREEIADKKGVANSYNNIGIIHYNQGNYEKALENYDISLKIRKEIDDKAGLAMSYHNIGSVYEKQGNYEKSLENNLNSLSIKEQLGDRAGIAMSYNNIGILYERQKDTVKALENYMKYLKISEEMSNRQGIAYAYNNIGNIYMGKEDYEKALENQFNSLKIKEEIGDAPGIAMSYSNIGSIYERQKKYSKAIEYALKSLKLTEVVGDTQLMATCCNNLGLVYQKLDKPDLALSYNNKSVYLSKKIGFKSGLKDGYVFFLEFYSKKGDFKKACEYHKLYTQIKDSLLNEESAKQLAEMDIKYDSEKKDLELLKKDTQLNKQQAEAEKKKIQRNIFLIGFIILLLLALYVFISLRQKQTANRKLEDTNHVIEKQKQLVEDKNEKIADSITYAHRIQTAILPSPEEIKAVIPDCFILFKPKDIVSGDFYWMHVIDKNQVLVAAVDCTGHGVPGALMSILGFSLLEQIVKEQKNYEPASILNELGRLIVQSLKQTDKLNTVKDGMDIALIKLNYLTHEVEYAGAHNPLYIVSNDALTEIKADRKSVGISVAKDSSFSNHKIQIKKGDRIYFFSDGFVDQKGGVENKKYFYKPFQELLKTTIRSSMEEQKEQLLSSFDEWKGSNKQADDVLVIGIKL
jgi:serine phosphatase RsbU (regulator of sigma subunit)